MTHVRVARVVAWTIAATLLSGPAAAYAETGSDLPADTTPTPPAPAASAAVPGVTAVTPTPAPVVVVRSYATNPARVTVGTEFDLTLTLYNATSRRADNVVVSLGQPAAAAGATATTGGLAVLGTGNAKYLGLLKGKTEATVTFHVIAAPGTTPGAITVPIAVSFEHQDARQEVAYTIGMLVERDATLSLVTAEFPDTVMVGETFDASFEVANASAYALSGVTLSVQAPDADVIDGSIFLGTMDAATTESLDVSITPGKAGDLEIAVVVAYRDDFGRPQEFRETRTVRVEAAPEPGDIQPGAETPEDDGGSGNWFVNFIKALFGLGS